MNGLEVLFGQVRRYQRQLEGLFNEHEDLDESERVDPQLMEWLVRCHSRSVLVRDGGDAVDQRIFYFLNSHSRKPHALVTKGFFFSKYQDNFATEYTEGAEKSLKLESSEMDTVLIFASLCVLCDLCG